MMLQKQDKKWMETVDFMANKHSKCKRAKYCSLIISRHGNIVGEGYNGKPAGSCNDDLCYREGLGANAEKSENVCCNHSETNLFQRTNWQDAIGGTMYVNGIPCKTCMLGILGFPIKRLVYLNSFSSSGHTGSSSPEEMQKQYGIEMEIVSYSPLLAEKLYG
jgi:deoxycytidylate deaminase